MESLDENDRNPNPNPNDETSRTSPSSQDLKVSIAGSSGNLLEWYDFAIFGLFSDVIGDNFFPPNQEGNAALVETFAVFGLAFLVRPIGGIVIGKLGDTDGRKGALEISMFMMGFSTCAIGFLPTYSQVGPLATVSLILMRILQGLSCGGQKMASVLFVLEQKSVSEWGYWGGVVFAIANIGASIGTVTATVIRDSLSDEAVELFGWRIPFVLGIVGVLPAFYLKYNAEEKAIIPSSSTTANDNITFSTNRIISQNMETDDKSVTHSVTAGDPLKKALSKKHRKAMIAAILIPTLDSATHYLMLVWLVIFMSSIVNPPVPHAFNINVVNGVLGGVVLAVLGGWFADYIGNYSLVFLISASLLIVLSPPCFALVGAGLPHSGVIAFLIQLILVLFSAGATGALVPWVCLLFPPEIRLTSVSLGFNISTSIWGGFSPLLATIFADQISYAAPGYLLSIAGILSLIGLWIGDSIEKEHPQSNVIDDEDGRTPLLQ